MKFEIRNLLILLCAILVCVLFAGESKVHAQSRGVLYTVNDVGDTLDVLPGDGICADAANKCTLRAAIGESNTTIERDAIVFSLPQPSTINLTLGSLNVSRSLDVAGPGARRLTIQRSTQGGTPNFRVFNFAPGQSVSNIRGVSIRNGHDSSGGGILIGALHLVDVVDCSLIGNHATGDGGAIKADGSRLVLLRVLIASNVAETNGGGVHLMANTLDANITNSTFTANSAATGGAINNGGPLVLINNTVSQNSAPTSSSIHNASGSITVLNTIIGRDSPQAGTALSGQFISAGNNIVTDARNSTGFVHDVNGDQVSNNNVIDPMLGPLANNGGQSDTLAVLANSPAVDKANPCVINGNCPQVPGTSIRGRTDQRRFSRTFFGAVPEVGAFEQAAPPTFTAFATLAVFLGGQAVTRFTGSPVVLTNTRTLEKRQVRINILGQARFTQVRTDDDYIIENRAKRNPVLTPIFVSFD